MTITQRKLWQALLYETGAVFVVTPIIVWVFDHDVASSFWLSVAMSTIAVVWNYVFNSGFEAWERKQSVKGRSWQRRLAHGVGFEGGLALFFVPLIAWWLSVSWWVGGIYHRCQFISGVFHLLDCLYLGVRSCLWFTRFG